MKKPRTKQKTADKDVKKETTLPAPVPPAGSEPEEQPIPVPEPIPLPVPPPIAKQSPGDAKDSLSYDDVDHPCEQKEFAEVDGWGSGGGDGWGGDAGGGGSSGWGNDNSEWGDEGADDELESRNDGEEGRDHGGQTGTTAARPTIDQQQPSLGQPIQDHVPTQAVSTPAPPSPATPTPAAPIQIAQPHDLSESPGTQHTKIAPSQSLGQDPSHWQHKRYTFASTMANRNRPTSQVASSAPPSNRPSYYWSPNQPKQSMSTTKGPNLALTNLTPWGQPKNVDPWGDPKRQVPPPPPAPPPAPPAATQKRPAWYDWGRQPQTAAPPPPTNHRTDHDYDRDSDDGYTDDGYTDDDGEAHDAWGPPTHANHGWGPDPRKHGQVNNAPLGSGNGMSAGFKPVLSQAEHAQMLNAMLNNVHQDHAGHYQWSQNHRTHAPHHDPEPSHHHLEKARRLKQIAEEQRRSAMETEMRHREKAHKKHRDRGEGKSSQQQKRDDGDWDAPKDEWGAPSGWDSGGGQGQDDNGWGPSGNDEWDEGGNGWGKDGDNNSWGNQGDHWSNKGGGNEWDSGGDGRANNTGDGWNNSGGDSRGGTDDWGTGGDGRGEGGSKKDQNQGNTWAGYDNSWGAARASNGWDQNDDWGDGNGEKTWNDAEEEDWGEASRYHVVTDLAEHKSSKTFMYANAQNPQTKTPSTSLKLGLPQGTINESDNHAFQPAMKAIFGKELRMAKDRIHWTYSPENDPQVASILFWIQQMENYLALLGLFKFLETKERGALFVNVTFRLKEYPDKPAFDWLNYDHVQASTDRILQHSILATDPAQQTIIFVYLLSRTGNSVAMWRRKLQVPKDARQKHLQAIKKVKAGLRPDKDYRIHVDELPPSDKGKQTKPTKLLRSKGKHATKVETAKDQNQTKNAKSVLKTYQPSSPEKKRKWWQILRFAD